MISPALKPTLHLQPQRVGVLLPLPLSGAYDYAVEHDEELPRGTLLDVPLGPRRYIGIVWQPPTHFLKEAHDWSPVQIAASLAVLDVPWIIKPLYGLVSDFLPLAGYRRRPYLLLASIWSWTIIVNKWLSLATLRRRANKFEEVFWSGLSLDELYQQFSKKPDHPMANVFISALREWRRWSAIRWLSGIPRQRLPSPASGSDAIPLPAEESSGRAVRQRRLAAWQLCRGENVLQRRYVESRDPSE